MSSEPAFPSFENVRVATLTDLPRIASVAAAGFFWSPSFQFQRPYFADFPEDTLSSYWNEYQAMIVDPAIVVLVTEDMVQHNETERVYDALRKSALHRPASIPQSRVIVGVCSINLDPDSSLVGRFQATHSRSHMESSEVRALLSKSTRDQSVEAIRVYAEATAPAKKRYLAGQMRLGTLAVHPAYWNRGHATRLVSWCTRLADMEGATVGVSATPMGKTLAARAGFEEREVARVKQLGTPGAVSFEDVELWIGVRQPSQSPSEGFLNPSGNLDLVVAVYFICEEEGRLGGTLFDPLFRWGNFLKVATTMSLIQR